MNQKLAARVIVEAAVLGRDVVLVFDFPHALASAEEVLVAVARDLSGSVWLQSVPPSPQELRRFVKDWSPVWISSQQGCCELRFRQTRVYPDQLNELCRQNPSEGWNATVRGLFDWEPLGA